MLVVSIETYSVEFGDVDNLRKFMLTIKPCEMYDYYIMTIM